VIGRHLGAVPVSRDPLGTPDIMFSRWAIRFHPWKAGQWADRRMVRRSSAYIRGTANPVRNRSLHPGSGQPDRRARWSRRTTRAGTLDVGGSGEQRRVRNRVDVAFPTSVRRLLPVLTTDGSSAERPGVSRPRSLTAGQHSFHPQWVAGRDLDYGGQGRPCYSFDRQRGAGPAVSSAPGPRRSARPPPSPWCSDSPTYYVSRPPKKDAIAGR